MYVLLDQRVRAATPLVLPKAKPTGPVMTPAKSRESGALITRVELPPVEVMTGVESAGWLSWKMAPVIWTVPFRSSVPPIMVR